MAREGFPLDQVSAAIQEKSRSRREPVWDFANRLMKAAGLGSNTKASAADAVRSAEDWAQEGQHGNTA
jgi:hypothetical protein